MFDVDLDHGNADEPLAAIVHGAARIVPGTFRCQADCHIMSYGPGQGLVEIGSRRIRMADEAERFTAVGRGGRPTRGIQHVADRTRNDLAETIERGVGGRNAARAGTRVVGRQERGHRDDHPVGRFHGRAEHLLRHVGLSLIHLFVVRLPKGGQSGAQKPAHGQNEDERPGAYTSAPLVPQTP